MHSQHNFRYLELFAQLHHDRSPGPDGKLLTLNEIQRDIVLATLLANATIAPLLLNRENVNELLSGKKTWPDRQGNQLNLKSEVTVEALVESGILSFYNDYCKFNPCSIPDEEQFENKKLLSTIEKLYPVFYAHDVKPYFTISRSKAEELLSAKEINVNLLNLEEIETCDDHYIIELKYGSGYRHLHDNLVAELFSSPQDDKCAITFDIDKWLLITQFFPRLFLTQIDINKLSYEQKDRLAQTALEKIEHDKQLNVSPRTLTANWLCMSDSTWYIEHVENESDTDKAPPFYRFTIPDFVTYLETTSPAPLDFVLKANSSGWTDLGFNTLSRYFFLPLHIISIDLHADNNSFSTSDYTDRLFALADKNPELKYILLCALKHDNPAYIYYLLQRKDTACLAVLYYKDMILRLFDSHHPKGDATLAIHIFDKVCDEFSRHYFTDNILPKNESQQLALLLETLSKSSIRNDWNGMPNYEKTILDTLLDKIAAQYLVSIQEYIIEPDRLEARTSISGRLYLLFSFLEKHQNFPGEMSIDCISMLEDQIYHIVEYGLSGESINANKQLRVCSLLDNLPWWRLSERQLDRYRMLVGTRTKFFRQHSDLNISEYSYLQIRRCHFQIMLNMIKKDRDSAAINVVHRECLKIINSIYGDFDDGLKGLFLGSIAGDYSLWQLLISNVDTWSDDNFESIISFLKEHPDAEFAFLLLHRSNRKNRQQRVKSLIEKHYTGNLQTLSNSGLDEIIKTLNLACTHNYMDYAEKLLSQANDLLYNKQPRYLNQQTIDFWKSIEYKVKTLTICNNELLSSTEKEEQINNLDVQGISARHSTDCDHFRRNCLATLYIYSDSKRASNIYDNLYLQTKSLLYAGNRLSAKFNLLVKTDADAASYQTVLDEWLRACKDTSPTVIEDVFVQAWMACLYKLENNEKIDVLWGDLLPCQKYTIAITKIYVQMQHRQNHRSQVIEIINEWEHYHRTPLDDAELIKLRANIQNGIADDLNTEITMAVAKKYFSAPKTIDELASAYSQIFTHPLSDIDLIINANNPSTESFLFENVREVVGELLRMKFNLNKKDDNGKYSLINENAINNWFASLFKHRGTYAGITCHEQEPSGISPRGKALGEIDFFFYTQRNSCRVAIGEAFNLTCFNRDIIKQHIDKITLYDQQSLDTVIFFAWCSVNDFIALTDTYYKECYDRSYNGFKSLEHFNVVGDKTDTLVILKEVRLRNTKPVTIYHFLVNLRHNQLIDHPMAD
ncbi:hypothetical protein [Citrobacter freundii]|uniref:hypothetical protein n=1 Tax=Citrobacter freundii TaxID=546 RepID=UPI0019020252|nr:hypothetical protein [Citrobacter freundii]MBJ8982779.1 hypothetical protein [Citrobacter freundii]